MKKFSKRSGVVSLRVIHLWGPQKGGRGDHEILGNLADGCGWFLGRGHVFF